MFNNIKTWFNKNYMSIIRFTYIIPILFVAGVSIAHVITWYEMTNPLNWAIYLSVGVEIAALSALAGMSSTNNKAVYLPFGIVTLIQFIGNMFFTFQYIDTASELFNDWVTLVDPLFSIIGMVDSGDLIAHKRWLSVLSGAMLPLISLSFLHLLVKFNDTTINSYNNIDTSDTIIDDNNTYQKNNKDLLDTNPIIEEEKDIFVETSINNTDENITSDDINEEKIVDTIQEDSIEHMVIEEDTIEDNKDIIKYDDINTQLPEKNEEKSDKPQSVKSTGIESKGDVSTNVIQRINSNEKNNNKNLFFRRNR
jgi:hypothetical protein